MIKKRKKFLELASKAARLARQEAKELRKDAEYGGANHDGGASELEDRVDIWISTLLNEYYVPDFMAGFFDKTRSR